MRRRTSSAKKRRVSTESDKGAEASPTLRCAKGVEVLAAEYLEEGELDRAAQCLSAAMTLGGETEEGGRAALRLGELLFSHSSDIEQTRNALEIAVRLLPPGDAERYRAASRLSQTLEYLHDLRGAHKALEIGLEEVSGPDQATARGYFLCLIQRSAILTKLGEVAQAGELLVEGIAAADKLGHDFAHTLATLKLLKVQQSLCVDDVKAAEAGLADLGLDDNPDPAWVTLRAVSLVFQLDVLGRQHNNELMRSVMREVHTVMKDYKPPTDVAGGGNSVHFHWMGRKPLFVMVYLASIVVTTITGNLRDARAYAKRALDLIQRQLRQSRGEGEPSVSSQYAELVCSDYHVPLLEHCVGLHLSAFDFPSAQECLLLGIALVDASPERFRDRRPSWHLLLATYFDATRDAAATTRHMGLATASAVRDDDRLAVVLTSALLAVRSDDGAEILAELLASCETVASPDAKIVQQLIEGLRRLCAGDISGAKDLVTSLTGAKSVSKRLGAFVLMATAVCCKGDAAAAESDMLLARAEKFAKSMEDKQLQRCVQHLGRDDDSSIADEAAQYDEAVAVAQKASSHQKLLQTWTDDA